MKKVVLLLLFISTLCSAQRSGVPIYLDSDTLKGVDTVYIQFPEFKSFYALSLELTFKQIGGTSDGVCYLLAANDTNYVNVTTVEGAVNSSPNDTIPITNGGTGVFWIYGNPSNNFKYMCIGTVGDTTEIIPNYIRK